MSWVPTPSPAERPDGEEVKALSAGLAEAALGRPAEIAGGHIRRVVKSSISAFSATESVSLCVSSRFTPVVMR
ncbi:Uncharacterised protein [Klebsiella pneumoniae]|uniref:Uncharacterized protein n=1 Tax=Klebsiella pneumoniae TaxID=573 RepID=A0A3S4I1R1_KLEPN|nr:Uncharacterised protein [Klebsiella pneumoniae]